MCATCGDAVVQALLCLPGLLTDLTIARSRLDRLQAQRIGGKSANVPLPVRATGRGIRMHGDGALAEVEKVIATWANVLAAYLDATVPLGRPGLIQLVHNNRGDTRDRAALSLTEASPLEQTVVWMACQPMALRSHPSAGQLMAELSGALERLSSSIDRPVAQRYVGPCPTVLADGLQCRHDLRAERIAKRVRCRRCDSWHEVEQIEAIARSTAEDQLWPLADLLRVLDGVGAPVPRSTLYRWARQHRLEVRGWQHHGPNGIRTTNDRLSAADVAVYRLGDVLVLASGGVPKA
ncbi:hypothetical protein [Nocardia sp. NPDC058480]|uniref:hypothetical protein n=1 Tax=unclassified Nocardia TaxID=2637762 RepID=UPI00364B20E7